MKWGVETVGGREELTITFTRLPTGTTQFHFTAEVQGPGYFENTAQFVDGPKKRSTETNATYHASELHKVTEKYREWGAGTTLKPDTFRYFGTGLIEADYSPYPGTMRTFTDGGDTWRYYGYQRAGVDGAPIEGPPPSGKDALEAFSDPAYWWCWKNVSGDEEIILFFVKDVEVTVRYKDKDDPNGPDLKPSAVAAAPGLQAWSMPVPHMDAFDVSSDTWTYAGFYSLDGGISRAEEGSPPAPAFGAQEMAADQSITLYFTKKPVITVQYREYREDQTDRRNSALLFNAGVNKESFLVDSGSDFDPFEPPSVADAAENGVENTVGKAYKIYRGWSDDKGLSFHEGPPDVYENVQANHNVILYFSTVFAVTEQFHQYPGEPLPALAPDISTTAFGGDTFTGDPPAVILDGSWRWAYVGYRLGTDLELPMLLTNPEGYVPPALDNISSDEIVIYL